MVCPSQATHSLLVISRAVPDFYSHFGRRIYNIYGCRMNARKKFRGTTEAGPGGGAAATPTWLPRRWEPAEGGTVGLPSLWAPPPPRLLQGRLPPARDRVWEPASTGEADEDELSARERKGGRARARGLGRLGGE